MVNIRKIIDFGMIMIRSILLLSINENYTSDILVPFIGTIVNDDAKRLSC